MPRDAVAGTGPAVLDSPFGTVGVVISWEVFFGDRARDGVGNGGRLLLNPTNGSSYTGTILQSQQVASSRLRALETGRWVVQVAPTGFTAFVTPRRSRCCERTGISEQAVRVRDGRAARRAARSTSRFGDWPVILLARRCCRSVVLGRRAVRPEGRRPLPGRTSRRPAAHTSRSTVTGPSLTSSTAISVRNRPVATVAPSRA